MIDLYILDLWLVDFLDLIYIRNNDGISVGLILLSIGINLIMGIGNLLIFFILSKVSAYVWCPSGFGNLIVIFSIFLKM